MAKPGFNLMSPSIAAFAADMVKMRTRLPAALKEEDKWQAGDIAKEARARGRSMGSVHAKAAPGIVAVNQSNIIDLRVGEHPYILGAEFGGGRRPTTRQFPEWRGRGENAGYMLFPTVRERSEAKFEERYADVVQDVAGW